jgi:DNA-binding transcriptional LysR family regulator
VLNVKQLLALRAVATSRSVTEAADKLHITQPAVSRMIVGLEREVGFALFTRHRGRLVITPQGEAFFEEVERALLGLEEISRVANNVRFGGGAILRLFAMSSIADEVVPTALQLLRQDYPNVITSLEIRGGRDVTHWSSTGRQFDLGMILVPRGHRMISTEPFAGGAALAVMHATHPLAEREVVSLDDLAKEWLVMLPSTSLVRRWLEGRFAQQRIIPKIVMETSMVSACHFAMLGLGVAIGDPLAIRSLATSDIAARPISPALAFDYSFVLPIDRKLTPMVSHLMNVIRSTTHALLADATP